jgi:beta-mannosidase
VLLTFQPEPDGSLSLYVCNDSDAPYVQDLEINRDDFDSKTLATQRADVKVPPRSLHRVPIEPHVAAPRDPSRELLWVDKSDALWFFRPDKELAYPTPQFEAELRGNRLMVSASTLLRDVCIFIDRLDPRATVSEQVKTVLAGESCQFIIESELPLTMEQLTSPPVFRCVNPFGNNIRL